MRFGFAYNPTNEAALELLAQRPRNALAKLGKGVELACGTGELVVEPQEKTTRSDVVVHEHPSRRLLGESV